MNHNDKQFMAQKIRALDASVTQKAAVRHRRKKLAPTILRLTEELMR